jgi:hypothetical protein
VIHVAQDGVRDFVPESICNLFLLEAATSDPAVRCDLDPVPVVVDGAHRAQGLGTPHHVYGVRVLTQFELLWYQHMSISPSLL